MLQRAIDILKGRWPEVMLIVVLQAAMMLFSDEMMRTAEAAQAQAAAAPFGTDFLLGIGFMSFAIIWQMIYLGFLKTAALSNAAPHQPMDLLRSGRPYFWRILLFQLMIGFTLMLVNVLMVLAIGALIWKGRPVEDLPRWVTQICALAGILIALKPLLLAQARVIVRDETLWEAIGRLWYCRLADIRSFFATVSVCFGLLIGSTLLVSSLEPKTPAFYAVSGLHHAIFSFILLTLALIVVLWTQQQLEAETKNQNREDESI